MPNQKQGFVGVFGNEKVELNNELEIVSMISMNQKTTSEEWEIKFLELLEKDTGENDYKLIDFISTLIAQKQKEVLEACLPENPNQNKDNSISIINEEINGWVINGYRKCRSQIIQTAKEKFNIDL